MRQKMKLRKQYFVEMNPGTEDEYSAAFDSIRDCFNESSDSQKEELGVRVYVAVPVYLGTYKAEEVTRVFKVKPKKKTKGK